MWVVIAFVCIIAAMLAHRWWRGHRAVQASATQLEALIMEARVVSQDMEEMLTSAVDISRSVIDDVESKIKEVQTLNPPALTPLETHSDPVAQFYQELVQGQITDHEPETIAGPVPEPAAPAIPAVLRPEDYPAYREMHPYMAVRQLQEQGFSILEISQILNRGQGEINLILNLSRRKKMG